MYYSNCFSDSCIVSNRGVIHFHWALLSVRSTQLCQLLQDLAQLQKNTGLNKLSSSSPLPGYLTPYPLKAKQTRCVSPYSDRQSRHTASPCRASLASSHPCGLDQNSSHSLFQTTNHLHNSEKVLIFHLPDVQHSALQQCIESLYVEGRICALKIVIRGIRERIEWLQQLCELKRRRVPLQPLDVSACHKVHKEIFEQLVNEQVNVVPINESKLKCFSKTPKRSSRTSSIPLPSRLHSKFEGSANNSPYNSHTELRSHISHSNPLIPGSTADNKSLSSKSLEVVDLSTYLKSYNSNPRKRSNTVTLYKGQKKPRLKDQDITVAKQHSGKGSLTEQFLLARSKFVSYEKCFPDEKNTKVRGLNMKMTDGEEHIVKHSKSVLNYEGAHASASSLEAEKMENDQGASGVRSDTCKAKSQVFRNGSSEILNTENQNVSFKQSDSSSFPSVRAKVQRLESINNEDNPVEKIYNRSQSCSEPPTISRSSEKRSSLCGEASGLPHLDETSSMEVEATSSTASSDSTSLSAHNAMTERDQNVCLDGNAGKPPPHPPPPRPLVRTRTFEIINHSPGDSSATSHNVDSNEQNAGTSGADHSQETVVLRKKKIRTTNTPINIHNQPDASHVVNPDQLREMERQKGAMIFENSFQTFSNIPTTNMMSSSLTTCSLSSESSSMGLTSLFSSMMEGSLLSMSTGGEPMSRPPSVALSSINYEDDVNFDPSAGPIVAPTRVSSALRYSLRNKHGNGCVTKALSQDQSSLSPSPDSLMVEQRRLRTSINDQPDPDSLMSGKSDLKCSYESTVSANKEDLDTEEKERDDLETSTEPMTDSSQMQLDEFGKDSEESKPFFQVSSGLSSLSGSPRIVRRAEHAPIISGGSTMKKELCSEVKTVTKVERQISTGSVKDVDSIPVVSGFVNLPEKENQDKNDIETDEVKQQQSSDSQPQSMFSMFIDLNEIPSPVKAVKNPVLSTADKAKVQHQAVYMFIEADNPSPKARRKSKPESELLKKEQSSLQSDSGPNSVDPSSKVQTSKLTAEEISNDNQPKETNDNDNKKGFFMFIEAEASSNSGSPKPRRKPPILTSKKSSKESSVMSKSAPSDVLLMATRTEVPEKLCSRPILDGDEMTKSVIDRKDYMEQPVTKRNVSLDNKINESSSSQRNIKEGFVSGIPRPIHLLKSKSCSKVPVRVGTKHRSERISTVIDRKPPSGSSSNQLPAVGGSKGSSSIPQPIDPLTAVSKEFSELTTSLTGSLSEVASVSLPLDESVSSDISSLLDVIERTRSPTAPLQSDRGARLADDLLRMLEEEINTDVIVQIGDHKIKAHKCILASRCVYFAAMLSGRWKDGSSGPSVIKLQGFSAASVMLALRHIYTGSSNFDETDNISSEEVAALADMLALDGLKDAVALHLKVNRCHYFHKPCVGGCIEGVLESLVISSVYSLEELFVKCLRWVAKHFSAVLPTKQFAQLPSDLHKRCLRQMQYDLSVSSVLETVVGCTCVLSSLPVVKWAQPTFTLTNELLEAATGFIAANLSAVIDSDKFLSVCRGSNGIGGDVEEALLSACQQLTAPDQAVLSHIRLTKLLLGDDCELLNKSQEDVSSHLDEANDPDFVSLLEKILNEVESFLIHNAGRASVCRQWPLLPVSVQRRIKEAAPAALYSRYSVASSALPPQPHRPRLGSLGSKGSKSYRLSAPPSCENKLARSASASNVPPSLHSKQPQTMPAALNRSRPASMSTPPPTRASTLRARQAALARTGAKASDGSSTDENRSPRSVQQQRGAGVLGGSRPHTPISRPTSRPLTPAHRGSNTPSKRNSFNIKQPQGSSDGDANPPLTGRQALAQHLNSANNNRVSCTSGVVGRTLSNKPGTAPNVLTDGVGMSGMTEIRSTQPSSARRPPPSVSVTNPPPATTRSRTFLKDDD